jgi:hypothetical protein
MPNQKQYLGLKLAASAVDSISSLNDSRRKRNDLWLKVLQAREENNEMAKIQSSQAWPLALAATLNVTAAFAAGAMATLAKNNSNLNNWLKGFEAIPKFADLSSSIWNHKKEGQITLLKAKVTEKEATQHMKRSDMSNDESLIQRITDSFTRSIHSLTIA